MSGRACALIPHMRAGATGRRETTTRVAGRTRSLSHPTSFRSRPSTSGMKVPTLRALTAPLLAADGCPRILARCVCAHEGRGLALKDGGVAGAANRDAARAGGDAPVVARLWPQGRDVLLEGDAKARRRLPQRGAQCLVP